MKFWIELNWFSSNGIITYNLNWIMFQLWRRTNSTNHFWNIWVYNNWFNLKRFKTSWNIYQQIECQTLRTCSGPHAHNFELVSNTITHFSAYSAGTQYHRKPNTTATHNNAMHGEENMDLVREFRNMFWRKISIVFVFVREIILGACGINCNCMI